MTSSLISNFIFYLTYVSSPNAGERERLLGSGLALLLSRLSSRSGVSSLREILRLRDRDTERDGERLRRRGERLRRRGERLRRRGLRDLERELERRAEPTFLVGSYDVLVIKKQRLITYFPKFDTLTIQFTAIQFFKGIFHIITYMKFNNSRIDSSHPLLFVFTVVSYPSVGRLREISAKVTSPALRIMSLRSYILEVSKNNKANQERSGKR